MAMTLSATDFPAGGSIPSVHTCDGQDTSPALSWTGIPPGARSLALVVVDPDAPDPAAPRMTWVHWVLYNIPPHATGLPSAVGPGELPPGTRTGINDFGKTTYGGPCPPVGRHRYFHRLYALDVELPDLGHPTRQQLEKAMQGHVLAQAELVGTYQRE